MQADEILEEIPFFPENEGAPLRKLDYLGYAPCPVRHEMQLRMNALFKRHEAEFGETIWFSPGSCGSESDPYDLIWKGDSEDAMPGVISDGGSSDYFRREGFERWIQTGVYAPPNIERPATRTEIVDAADPMGVMNMYATFPAVILVDKQRLGSRPVPKRWGDLLDPAYRGDITVGGHGAEISDLLLFNMWKHFGENGLRKLAANVKNFWPPAQMAKVAGSSNDEGTAIYILNYFFARGNRHEDKAQIVWPEEGAWFNPLTVLAKPEDMRRPASQLPIDFLFSAEWAQFLDSVGMPSALTYPGQKPLPGKLSWMGWDFVRSVDMDAMRPCLRKIFNKARP